MFVSSRRWQMVVRMMSDFFVCRWSIQSAVTRQRCVPRVAKGVGAERRETPPKEDGERQESWQTCSRWYRSRFDCLPAGHRAKVESEVKSKETRDEILDL